MRWIFYIVIIVVGCANRKEKNINIRNALKQEEYILNNISKLSKYSWKSEGISLEQKWDYFIQFDFKDDCLKVYYEFVGDGGMYMISSDNSQDTTPYASSILLNNIRCYEDTLFIDSIYNDLYGGVNVKLWFGSDSNILYWYSINNIGFGLSDTLRFYKSPKINLN